MNQLVSLAVALSLVLAAGPARADKDGDKQGPVTHVDATAAAKLLAAEDAKEKPVVLDIRTPEEFAGGHLEDARNINFSADDFEAKIAKLDKAKPYIVHCRSGGRSGRSLATFEKLGFKRIYHLDGGIIAWEEAKQPVVK